MRRLYAIRLITLFTVASTVQTERLGVAAVNKAFGICGWFFREQPQPDQGIDAQVECVDEAGQPNGRLLALQIKAGTSYFGNPTAGGWRHSVKRSHLSYWTIHSLPVLIVLYNPDRDVAYWQVVSAEHLAETAKGGFTIYIPEDQVLDKSALPALEQLANAGLPTDPTARESTLRDRRAELDIGWMEFLAAGDRLFVEADEWVNKTSGRGSVRLIAVDEQGRERVEREWPWVFLPEESYSEELGKLFPWADLEIDVETYREHEYVEFIAETGVWDDESGDYFVAQDFDEWLAEQPPLRPYAESAGGEVAHWRLELKLNELGRRTIARVHEEYLADAEASLQAEQMDEETRGRGWYQGDYGDAGRRSFERVLFASEDSWDALLVDDDLWTTDAGRKRTAAAILEHALEREASEALVDAFLSRFHATFDDEGYGWTLDFVDVRKWLDRLGVRFD